MEQASDPIPRKGSHRADPGSLHSVSGHPPLCMAGLAFLYHPQAPESAKHEMS